MSPSWHARHGPHALFHFAETQEKPRNHVDLRGRIDSKGVRYGKIIPYKCVWLSVSRALQRDDPFRILNSSAAPHHTSRYSEVRVIEVLNEQLCDKLPRVSLQKVAGVRSSDPSSAANAPSYGCRCLVACTYCFADGSHLRGRASYLLRVSGGAPRAFWKDKTFHHRWAAIGTHLIPESRVCTIL